MATLTNFRQKGYKQGFPYGYWMGQCEAVTRSLPIVPSAFWPKRVLYVTSGKGLPYSVLDTAIIESIRPLVQQLDVTEPNEQVIMKAEICQPDLVLVFDGMHMPVNQVRKLRRLGCRTAVWFADDPYYIDVTETLAVHYDDVFTLELNCVSFYEKIGCARVYYLPLAANPFVFRPGIVPRKKLRDIVFIGSAYWNRVHLFDEIAPFLAQKNMTIAGSWWKRLNTYELLASKIEEEGWKTPEETAQAYSGSRIVINVHRAHDDHTFNRNWRQIEALSPNPRTFEIACCGTLQITDCRSDLARFYNPGPEIATFSSPEELTHKIDYYLHHEDERREIAIRGLVRTLREHTYIHRMQQLLSHIFGPGVSAV